MKAIGVATLLCALTLPVAMAEPSRTIGELGPVKVGKPCPSFGGFTLGNEPLSLSKLLRPGKEEPATAVVVSFFATYCKVCKEKLPVIERVVGRLKSKGARGVLVDYGEEPDLVGAFAQAQHIGLPVIPDKFVKIAGRLGVDKTLPRTIVVDGRGSVVAIFDHEGDDFEQALLATVEKAMRGN